MNDFTSRVATEAKSPRLQCELEDYGDNFADKPCNNNECENCHCSPESDPDRDGAPSM